MFEFPQCHSWAPPPLILPQGWVLLNWSSASRREEVRRSMSFQLWLYNSAFQTTSLTASSCRNGWTLFESLCVTPLKINHTTIRKQSLNFVSCTAVGYTCTCADKCVFSSLEFAAFSTKMGYLNILYAHKTGRTTQQLKKNKIKIIIP